MRLEGSASWGVVVNVVVGVDGDGQGDGPRPRARPPAREPRAEQDGPVPAAWFDPAVTCVLTLAALVALASTLPSLDMGGDAAWKWAFVRCWGRGLPWVFDHHTARFAINLPIYLSQRAFGAHPNAMYVAPIAFALMQVPLVVAIGRRIASRPVAVVAALSLIAFGPWATSASQLLPGVFQTTYLLFALYAHCRFAEQPGAKWLIATGVALFAAYLAMISSLYFLPGFVLATLCVRRRASDVLLWASVLFGAIALETAAYALFSEFPAGQLQIVRRTHDNIEPIQFWELFRRFGVLPATWRLALAAGSGAAIVLLALGRQPALLGLPWIAGVFLLGSTFGVKSLDPLVPALNFRDRYFDPLAPLIALMVPASIAVVASAWKRGWRSELGFRPPFAAVASRAVAAHAGEPRPALLPAGLREPAALALTVVLAALTALAVVSARGASSRRVWADNAAHFEQLTSAFLAGVPIVGKNARDHDQIKTLTVIAYVFLADEAFLALPDPRRPLLYRSRDRRRSYRVLSRSELAPEPLARAIRKARCVVFAARRTSEPRLVIRSGAACEAAAIRRQ